uniref:ECF transporter S component n=1 Tax=Acetatifactor sp. TaxID=1872090 RepID=UPI004056BC9F
MKTMHPLYKTVSTAVCIALCVILPFAFHIIPEGGTLFSPMHLPALLCGIVCGPVYGLLCGLCGPFLSSLLTGMPGMGYLPTMMVELAIYGLVTGLMMKLIHTGKLLTDLYISLITAMLAGRIITGILRAMIFTPGAYSLQAWATGYFISCFPAIILQLILIPILYVALQKARLAPNRNVKQQ